MMLPAFDSPPDAQAPCGDLRARWGGTLPAGLLGMIVLVTLVESFLAARAADFTPWGTWAWRQSGQAASRRVSDCEILCFGDSLVKLGVLPLVLEQKLGGRAYNLSICAAQAPASYFLLRRALAAGARPKAIIVDYKPNMLAGGPRDFARNWPELLTLRECLDLALAARDPSFFASTALALTFSSVRSRHDIRVNLLLALGGKPGHLRASTLEYERNWESNRGGQATARNPLYRGEVGPEMQKKLLSHVFWCNRVNAAYIRRFLALAESRRIKVFWLLPPISPAVQEARERSGADAAYARFVARFQDEFPSLVVVDGRHAGYDHRVLIDAVHLDRQGATTVTADVADIVARYTADGGDGPAGSRWVNLPSYRDLPAGVALEEIVDFNVAVQAGKVRR